MVQSSKEKMRTVRHQFDYFCKKILHGEKVNYEREMEYRGKHEISFSQLTQEELGQLNSMDEYTAEEAMFCVLDYDVVVKDDLISEALKTLPEKNGMLFYFHFSWI